MQYASLREGPQEGQKQEKKMPKDTKAEWGGHPLLIARSFLHQEKRTAFSPESSEQKSPAEALTVALAPFQMSDLQNCGRKYYLFVLVCSFLCPFICLFTEFVPTPYNDNRKLIPCGDVVIPLIIHMLYKTESIFCVWLACTNNNMNAIGIYSSLGRHQALSLQWLTTLSPTWVCEESSWAHLPGDATMKSPVYNYLKPGSIISAAGLLARATSSPVVTDTNAVARKEGSMSDPYRHFKGKDFDGLDWAEYFESNLNLKIQINLSLLIKRKKER